MSLLHMLTLFIGAGLFAVIWQLRKIDSRIDHLANQMGDRDADSVHDAAHPVFSVHQLRRARQRFEVAYKIQLQLETELYESNDWRAQTERTRPPSSQLRERLRTVCEAIVQSECAWKEYVYMVEGNLSVAAGRESRAVILQGFRNLLTQTRGVPTLMTVAPNATKVRRVEQVLSNWTARLAGTASEDLAFDLPDIAEEVFDVSREEGLRSLALRQ